MEDLKKMAAERPTNPEDEAKVSQLIETVSDEDPTRAAMPVVATSWQEHGRHVQGCWAWGEACDCIRPLAMGACIICDCRQRHGGGRFLGGAAVLHGLIDCPADCTPCLRMPPAGSCRPPMLGWLPPVP